MKQKYKKNLTKVFVWLESKQKTNTRQMTGSSEKLWKSWVEFRNLEKVNGLLYKGRKAEKSGQVLQQLVVAETQIAHILSLPQQSPCTGQFGVRNTYHGALERFFRPGMKPDVQKLVDSCDQCLRRKGTPQKHRHCPTIWQHSHLFWKYPLT